MRALDRQIFKLTSSGEKGFPGGAEETSSKEALIEGNSCPTKIIRRSFLSGSAAELLGEISFILIFSFLCQRSAMSHLHVDYITECCRIGWGSRESVGPGLRKGFVRHSTTTRQKDGLVLSDQQEMFGACTPVGDNGAPHSSSFTRDMDRNVNVATAHLLLHEQQYFLIPVRYIDAVQ